MRVHAILCVRDEADIVAQSVRHALAWAGAIHVYDTGSTDGTWEIVQDLASRERAILPIAREEVVFDNDVRGYIFERVKHTFRPGDWVCRMDADEFYADNPGVFLRERVAWNEGRVFTQHYEFAFTSAHLAAWERGEESIADRSRPIEERRRRYHIEPLPEPRFCRFRRTMRWGRGHNFPFSPGLIARERIGVRHYRWRDPEQMRARCLLRAAMARVSHHGPHWDSEDWKRWVTPADHPWLREWTPGEPLPPRDGREHLLPEPKASAQRLMYTCGLPYLTDLARTAWRPDERPRAAQ